ncbi:putative 4Fe-4S ferredoxin, iron-sulfur binding, leucine-rich repeat domain superfamily [Dioscorea sansibarensis]
MENFDFSHPLPDPMPLNASDPALPPMEPHGAFFLVLGYLRLPDLLAFQSVCRLFRDAIASDRLLWMRITVEPPLSGRLTDDTLLKLTSRAGGTLKSLALLDCWKITDAGLLQVVDRNPTITELYIPGCTYLTADGVVSVVRRLTERKGKLKRLRLRGLCNISRDHLDSLNFYLGINDHPQCSKPSVYNHWKSLPLNDNDDRPIDVDICPKCKNARLVFDCTRENCRSMKYRWSVCRGCFFCIARCEECGGCVDFEELGEETVCAHLLCIDCWLQLPKCSMCNRPYCKGHINFRGSSPAFFVCDQCGYDESMTNDIV